MPRANSGRAQAMGRGARSRSRRAERAMGARKIRSLHVAPAPQAYLPVAARLGLDADSALPWASFSANRAFKNRSRDARCSRLWQNQKIELDKSCACPRSLRGKEREAEVRRHAAALSARLRRSRACLCSTHAPRPSMGETRVVLALHYIHLSLPASAMRFSQATA